MCQGTFQADFWFKRRPLFIGKSHKPSKFCHGFPEGMQGSHTG
ncbi:hypothetical protein AmDm5_0441 [Acetobacter malorum]|nr:hypothetical protein AmDm5_0441 [Acetobacter malorum]